MNNRGSISEKTRKKVLKAMKDLDYHPNEMARSLQTRRTHIIGAIIPYLDHPFFSQLAAAIENACYSMGYKLMICTSGESAEKEREMVSMLRSNKVDGMLVCSRMADASVYGEYELPIVSIERTIDRVPSVSCDNYQGGVIAAQVLARCGSKYPALIGNEVETYLPAYLRFLGFRDECKKLGIEPVEYMVELDDLFGENFQRTMADFICAHPEIDGLFGTGDILAVRALGEFMTIGKRLGSFPAIGFDGTDITEYLGVTTIAQPIKQMGEYAIELLIRRIENKQVPEQSILPVALVERRSTLGA